MAGDVIFSGVGGTKLAEIFGATIQQQRPEVIAVASAFVSMDGVDQFCKLLNDWAGDELRLIAGTSLAFTHPNALHEAQNNGWRVRTSDCEGGVFHPKLVLGGERFDDTGCLVNPCLAYIGSANLTWPALHRNIECGVLAISDAIPINTGEVFGQLWRQSNALTQEALRQYAAKFTRRNKARTSQDLAQFAISNVEEVQDVNSDNVVDFPTPSVTALAYLEADTVWVGLQSATGEYSFQPEFPRIVGEMIRRMLEDADIEVESFGKGEHIRRVCTVNVLCEDKVIRSMTYTYYTHNSMSRLNVPNEVPNAQWAREHKAGIAVVSRSDVPDAELSLQIICPGTKADEIIRRSIILGTWNKTPTRAYGWY